MLQHTFCHLPGIAAQTEQRLWLSGLVTWDDALSRLAAPRPPRRLRAADLHESARRHAGADVPWFAERLPSAQAWRLFNDFRAHCAYLDVETTGLSESAVVTTVALYDGKTVRTYVRGDNLQQFVHDVQAYRVLVTYNGKTFDLPILRRCLRCRLDQAHIDLRYVLAGLGLRGGLKGCERQVGLTRPGLEEVDGLLAVLLWHDYQRLQDRRSLETLLAYNVQDTVNLEALMVHAHNAYLARLDAPFAAGHRLPPPVLPAGTFQVDAGALARVLRERERILQGGVSERFASGG